MLNVPFLIQRPEKWISARPELHADNKALYDNVATVLNEWGHPVTITHKTHDTSEFDGILLAQHTICSRKNVWNLKKGYIPYYMNFDRDGYSGWSEMANSKSLFEKSQTTDVDEATDFVDNFVKKYAATNTSKFPQPKSSFNHSSPFLFVACQQPTDTVSKLASIQTYMLATHVAQQLHTDIDIVIKLHPSRKNDPSIDSLDTLANVRFTTASIHELIPKSVGVVTANSGVGFEALLHRKHVFTSGKSDYNWVTHSLQTVDDIITIPSILQQRVDTPSIDRFLYYMMTEHFVKADDISSVKTHLKRAIDEHEL